MKDIPLSEITLRKYEKPANLEKRELFRKICLSLGILQLGDSRDIIVDILMILVEANKTKERLTSDEINARVFELRKKYFFFEASTRKIKDIEDIWKSYESTLLSG